MLRVDGVVHLSASDLVGHLNCHYLTKLDLAVARGELDKPLRWDPVLEVLVERGALHEQSYLDHLSKQLSQEDISAARHLFERQLTNQVVPWASEIVYMVAGKTGA